MERWRARLPGSSWRVKRALSRQAHTVVIALYTQDPAATKLSLLFESMGSG